MVATAKVGNKLKVIVDRTEQGNWTITDLMRPGMRRTFRGVGAGGGRDRMNRRSLRAIDPYVRWWKEEMKRTWRRATGLEGGSWGIIWQGGAGEQEERELGQDRADGEPEDGGECSRVGPGVGSDRDAPHGEQTVEEAVEKLKGGGSRMVMPVAGRGRGRTIRQRRGWEAMPLRFRCREGLGQVLDWMKRNRMLVGLYQAYAWSQVPTDRKDWGR